MTFLHLLASTVALPLTFPPSPAAHARRPFNAQNPYLASARQPRALDGNRSCRHLELDLTSSRVRCVLGDVVLWVNPVQVRERSAVPGPQVAPHGPHVLHPPHEPGWEK